MKTKQTYYHNPYKKEEEAKILTIEPKGNLVNLILDQTIFYPEGGGQPSDTGIIQGQNGSAKVEYVRVSNGEIVHQAKVQGDLGVGENVKEILDWNSRYRYMRIHTAGHLLHDVLLKLFPNLIPLKGSHGKKPFLEYEGLIDINDKEKIEVAVNNYLQKDLIVLTKEVSYEELRKECVFIPPNLPKEKSLRMIKIGEFSAMPDGGVHVKSTKEIGKIWIANIMVQNGTSNIRYGVA